LGLGAAVRAGVGLGLGAGAVVRAGVGDALLTAGVGEAATAGFGAGEAVSSVPVGAAGLSATDADADADGRESVSAALGLLEPPQAATSRTRAEPVGSRRRDRIAAGCLG
jgi:hypothetical protein